MKKILLGLILCGVCLLFLGLNTSLFNSEQPQRVSSKMTNHGAFSYDLKYIPTANLIQRAVDKKSKATEEDLKNQYKDHYYFNLRIDALDGKGIVKTLGDLHGEEKVQDILTELSFYSKDKFQLNIGNTTFPSVLYHLDHSLLEYHGLDLMLVFRVENIQQYIKGGENDLKLTFENKYFSDVVEFVIEPQEIDGLNEFEATKLISLKNKNNNEL